MTMKFLDRANIGQVKYTQEGYLVTQARALRSGIQEYLASELGLIGDGIVRVYRPEESVKDVASLASMSHAPVTIGHPDQDVTSENWRDLAVGEVSTAAQWDGNFISLPLILKDKRAIEAVNSGMAELSAGYVADMTPVDNPDYDFVMGPPRYNHLAIVDKARAGSEARIGDSAVKPWGAAPLSKPDKKETEMDIVKVMIGDKAVSVAASDAEIVTKLMADLEAEKAAHAATKVEAADANRQIKTPDEIAAMIADGVKEIAEVAAKAAKLVKDFDAAGKSAMEIRREVIQKVYGDDAIADLQSDAEIKAAFAVARVEQAADPVRAAAADMAKRKPKEEGSAWDGMYRKKKGTEK